MIRHPEQPRGPRWSSRFRRAAAAALLALAALMAPPFASADRAVAEPAMWRVSDVDSTLWVFGSVHLLPPGLDWRRSELDQALAQSSIIFFEILLDPATEAEIQRRSLEMAFYANGETLSSQLSPEGAARLERILDRLGAPMVFFNQMRPWFASVTLEILISQADGALPEEGVDFVLKEEAEALGLEIRALESGAEALEALAGLPEDSQLAMFEQGLELYEANPAFSSELVAAWLSGDLELLETILIGALGLLPPDVYDSLITRRNQSWVTQLDVFLSGEGNALVVVGAGHMIGDDSILLMLETLGYSVERL